eukprot:852022-Amphidinium_carterae.1
MVSTGASCSEPVPLFVSRRRFGPFTASGLLPLDFPRSDWEKLATQSFTFFGITHRVFWRPGTSMKMGASDGWGDVVDVGTPLHSTWLLGSALARFRVRNDAHDEQCLTGQLH